MLTTNEAQTNLAGIRRDHPTTFTLQEASVNTYLAADTIRTLREARALTQRELATAVGVTDKAVSKWESGRGLPDISLIEGLATALGVSVAELLSDDVRQNANRAGNMARSCFYVCPICGNVVHAMGEGSFSCCGSQLLPQEPEAPDDAHAFTIERIEDDWYVTLDHPMTKQHFISFAAYVNRRTPPQEALSGNAGAGALPYHGSGHHLPVLQPARPVRPANAQDRAPIIGR